MQIELIKSKAYEIAENYDIDKQVDVLIEEMAELTKALLKNRRAQNGHTDTPVGHTVQNIIEEIADVQIMLLQINYLGDFEDDVIDIMNYKLDRQLERIEHEKKEK
jgi:NTP pyrophosphatase (non-canonical NTP hydrolase)